MPNKCCVYDCNGNYNKENKEKVFRLPKDPVERERWMKIIPRDNIPDNPNTVLCERHFPTDYETVTVFGRKRPRHPPSIFNCVKQSLIPTTPAPSRPTSKACSASRNILEDQMIEFLEKDKIKSFDDLSERMVQKKDIEFNNINIVSYQIGSETLIIQSFEFAEKSGIPLFMLKVKNNLSFEAYHIGIKCTIKSLSKNRVTILDTLSKLQEDVRYLFCMEIDQKKSVLLQQVTSMSSMIQVGDKKYTPAVIVRAFEYFVISRSLYKRLREDFELPSIPTHT